MDQRRYDCVFRAEIIKGRDVPDVKAQLCKLLHTEPNKIDALFNGGSVVVKKGVDRETALKYEDAFRICGAVMKRVLVSAGPLEIRNPGHPGSPPLPAIEEATAVPRNGSIRSDAGTAINSDGMANNHAAAFSTEGDRSTESAAPRVRSYERPLFVLKYRPYKVVLRIVFILFIGFFVCGGLLLAPNDKPQDWLVKFLGFFVCLVFPYRLIETAFFQELRLYNDRIMKVTTFGSREFKLADAVLGGGLPPSRLFTSRRIYDIENATLFLRFSKGIFYDESLADPQDVRTMYRVLAKLSGRKLEDFENLEAFAQMRLLVRKEG